MNSNIYHTLRIKNIPKEDLYSSNSSETQYTNDKSMHFKKILFIDGTI